MATGKKSFLLYADQRDIFDELPDDYAGKLIKHIFKYINDENPTTDDLILKIAFAPIRSQLKRDLKTWESTRAQRVESGRAGGIKSGKVRKQNEANEANASKSKQNEANEANASKSKQIEAKGSKTKEKEGNEAVNVNVNVNDNVKDINILTDEGVNNKIITVYENIKEYFDEDLLPKTKSAAQKWYDEIDKLLRIDKYTPEQIEAVVKYARSDSFWRTNFLSLLKLRKKNPEGLTYFHVFIKKLSQNGKAQTTKGTTDIELANILARKFGSDSPK